MPHDRLLQALTSVLLMGDYEVSERFSLRPRSFDLIARKGDHTYAIKVVSHIDSVSEELAGDLDLVARCLHGNPLIIGERARDSELERGAVYIRYGIYAMGIATLYDYIVEGIPPLVYASPGGLYVNLDGQALREGREQRNMSLGDLGALIGVSRRTISKYEAGMGTTLDVAMRIEEIFDRPLVREIEVEGYRRKAGIAPPEAGMATPMVFLERIGMKLRPMQRAPFQAMITYKEHTIITGYGPSQKVARRAVILGNLSRVAGMHAMCVLTDTSDESHVGRTLVIGESRLQRIGDGAELIDLIGI